jgi:EmrB/QacA subfamily drug resistance transporter
MSDVAGGAGLRPLRGGNSLAVAVLCGLLFLTFLDNTVVSVALGNIQHDLHAGVTPLQWIVNGYALAFAAVMLPAGAISDQFGRKKIMLFGATLFCIGSVVCAVAPDYNTLIIGRIIMGVGAAGSEPGTLSMLRQLFPEEPMRSRVFGVWAAISGLALALGPVFGGALVGIGGWRLIFWANLGLSVVLLVFGWLVLPESSDPRADPLDVVGAFLSIVCLGCLVQGVVRAENLGYRNTEVMTLLATSIVTGVLFVWRQRTAKHPLLDLHGVDTQAFVVANIAAFTTYFATFAVFLFTALYLQQVSDFDGYKIAVQFLPLTLSIVISAVISGRWTGRSGTRGSTTLGCLMFGVGLILTDIVISPNPNEVALTASLAVVGMGIGLTVVPITSWAIAAVPQARSGMAASATNASRELGAVIGVAVMGAVVASRLTGDLRVSLAKLPIPHFLDNLIINAIERSGTSEYEDLTQGHQSIKDQVVIAAHDAFGDGLHIALATSASLVFFSSVLIFVVGRRDQYKHKETSDRAKAMSGGRSGE